MPQRQATPTMYDYLGRPLFNRALNEGIKYGTRYAWQNWGKPAWDSVMGSAATEGGTTLAAQGAEEGALSGLGATSFGDYAAAAQPALAVAAPLIMGYLKYQAGSGVNEPLYKQQQTHGSGRMLSDMIAGKKVDPNNSYQDYGLRPKLVRPGFQEGEDIVDPRGYGAFELYDLMHDYGSGQKQTGGLGNSGYNDQQIDDMFGDKKGGLAKLLGVSALPDWRNRKIDDGFKPGEESPWSVGRQDTMGDWVANNPGKAQETGLNLADYNKEFNALPEDVRQAYEDKKGMGNSAPGLWRIDKEQEELEKLLGRKLSRQRAVQYQDPNAENMITNY